MSSIPSPSVHVHAARLAFAGVPLFDDLDFQLPGGSWTCLLGPSGVGKSTLLRILAGLESAGDQGQVACGDGIPLSGRAAYMAQKDLLLPWLSVIENAVVGFRLRGQRAPKHQARELLAAVGLADRCYARPDDLSGGMRQRVALVRTLVEDRPVILMDEPFSALDAITRFRLQSLASRLLAGRTVLLVTHDPLEALRLGHRIHVLAGRPARLGACIEPPGKPPRDPSDPAVLAAQADLLRRLAAAAEA